MNSPLEILKRYWKYPSFKGFQEAIINKAINKKDTFVLLPTGGGKSICYQIPPLLSDGICIVISPLIALMKDQVKSLKDKGLKAVALTSQLSTDELISTFDNLRYGNYKYLYLSPEKLQSKLVQEKIKQLNVALIAIDEAHCVSEWGHDFRPAYLELSILQELQPNAAFMALTATANEKVMADILNYLPLKSPQLFRQSYQRSNIRYKVTETPDIKGDLIKLLAQIKGSVIVYTFSRKESKEVSNYLNAKGFKSGFYHGGLSHDEKNEAYTNWMQGTKRIMVATNAFGMGIDKYDVRAVIHINIPQSIENFVQESGRAGRDDKTALSVLLYNEMGIRESTDRLDNYLATPESVFLVYNKLNQYYQIAIGDLLDESVPFSLQKFCNTYNLNFLRSYNAIKVLEREGILSIDDSYRNKSQLQLLLTSHQTLNYINTKGLYHELIQIILRSYGGISENEIGIDEFLLGKKLKFSKQDIIDQLQRLHKNGIVKYTFMDSNSRIKFLVGREDKITINRISNNIVKQGRHKLEKLNEMIGYIKNHNICRSRLMLSYFDEKIKEDCGVCDICVRNTKPKLNNREISDRILELVENQDLTSREIINALDINKNIVLHCLQILLEKDKLRLTSQQKFTRQNA